MKVKPTVEKWEREFENICVKLIKQFTVTRYGKRYLKEMRYEALLLFLENTMHPFIRTLLSHSLQEAKVEKYKSPEVEVVASSSFEEMLKLPDGQAVIVDVAKIRKAVQEAKAERDEEKREKLARLYDKTEKDKPPLTFDNYENQYNEGLYRGLLKALELVCVEVFNTNGDDLLASLKKEENK